jgi:hypothetical protein
MNPTCKCNLFQPSLILVIIVSYLYSTFDVMADTTAALSKCNENQQTMLLSLSWVFLSVAIFAVSGRLYFRLGLRNGIRADDYTIIASLVCDPALYIACSPGRASY